MHVLKFGGTSMGTAAAIQKVINIVKDRGEEDKLFVVVSAMSGTTDTLLLCGNLAAQGDESFKDQLQSIEKKHLDTVKELLPLQAQSGLLSAVKKMCNDLEDICNGITLLQEFSLQTKDRLVSYGELLSSVIIAEAMKQSGLSVTWKDTRELIKTDSRFSNALVDFEATETLVQAFLKEMAGNVAVLPGFIASDSAGATTTLGRGGSDYTASLIGAAVDAAVVEIWTDVSGMMTADPRVVPNARIIDAISYEEAMELCHFGAKVIYPPTIQPLLNKGIALKVKNTFEPSHEGTLIQSSAKASANRISGISSINKIALLSLEGNSMIGVPGFSKKLFEALAAEGINVILITQASSEHSICVGVNESDADAAKLSVDKAFGYEVASGKVKPLIVEKELAIIAVVGDGMKSHPGTSGKMFSALGSNGINIRAIAQGSSERNISSVIAATDVRKGINVLHEAFFETTNKQVNLFIVGTGNVGSRLIEQLQQQQQYLADHLRVQINVAGVANSRKMLSRDEGINLRTWRADMAAADDMDLDSFVGLIQTKNLRNSVFVDVTANEKVAGVYDRLLSKSISVVACNKIACSSVYTKYKQLKDLAREYNASFDYETNVGASLPVIGTLNDLVRSGDEVISIAAVLSGTLNYVFNNYDATRSFATIVKTAQDEGYTEPDPRLDLSGKDVMRKILILAREAGQPLEMEDIGLETFMPESCMRQATVAGFYSEMEANEDHFKALYQEAAAGGKKLKFVAQYKGGKASVGLQHIDPEHDFYHLYGKDNIVSFYTNRYTEQPLIVKGAGAGAEVTASGVFADILRAVRK